jgi:hypothetical protein
VQVCAAPSCADGVRNGVETDVDCGGGNSGGATCDRCAVGQTCQVAGDCQSGICPASTLHCAAPSCWDGVKNGSETGVDCGGGGCAGCAAGAGCITARDCQSGLCLWPSMVCSAASCADGIQNGSESDVDCGGSPGGGGAACNRCADGRRCQSGSDCASGVCSPGNRTCQSPTCADGVKNSNETDVDCGGGGCPTCANGRRCVTAADCSSGICPSATHTCSAPGCSDGLRNGSETDIDCGGPTCPACAIGKSCAAHRDCAQSVCRSGSCQQAASCAEILTVDGDAGSGVFTIKPVSAAAPLAVYCDMTTDGGGWTLLLQCLPQDNCSRDGAVLYNLDWLDSDYGAHDPNQSFLLGESLASLASGGHFMVQVTDTVSRSSGSVIYPLDVASRKFLSASERYESEPLAATVIDFDGGVLARDLRVCWMTAQTSPFARSYQGNGGLVFLGKTSGNPSATANSECDYGQVSGQMLLRIPGYLGLSTTFGSSLSPSWAAQTYAHRVFVRESLPRPVTLVTAGNGRRWSDGGYARSCYEYRAAPQGAGRSYSGAIGDGIYTIKPDETTPAVDVYCDMTTDGGGWTLVQRSLWSWAATGPLLTSYEGFYNTNIGDPAGAWRLAGKSWLPLNLKKEMLLALRARKASDGSSCAPLFYKGTGGTISADPAAKVFSATSFSNVLQLNYQTLLSTTDSGPAQACVNGASLIPWFYVNCCRTCPTCGAVGYFWPDEPHPMDWYVGTVQDLFGKTVSSPDICNGAAVQRSFEPAHEFYGINSMEVFLR